MQRRQDIELLRVISAFGIVWFHTRAVGGAVAYAGLVAFLTLSVWLAGQSKTSVQQAARRRVSRLLLPWLLWFIFYGLLNVAHGGTMLPLEQGWLAAVLIGPSIHLWYLPFIFVVLWLLDALRQQMPGPVLAYASGATTLTIVASAPLWRPISLSWPYPYLQWCDAAAPVFFGLFLACAPALPRLRRKLLTAAILVAALAVSGSNTIGISYGLGFAACVLMASGRLRDLPVMPASRVSEATFGVYLSHIALYALLLRHSSLSPETMAITVFVSALALIIGLRWLFPRLSRCVC